MFVFFPLPMVYIQMGGNRSHSYFPLLFPALGNVHCYCLAVTLPDHVCVVHIMETLSSVVPTHDYWSFRTGPLYNQTSTASSQVVYLVLIELLGCIFIYWHTPVPLYPCERFKLVHPRIYRKTKFCVPEASKQSNFSIVFSLRSALYLFKLEK